MTVLIRLKCQCFVHVSKKVILTFYSIPVIFIYLFIFTFSFLYLIVLGNTHMLIYIQNDQKNASPR